MKQFNTAGMKRLTKEDQDKWADWDWTSATYFQQEMAFYLHEQVRAQVWQRQGTDPKF